MNNIRQKTKKLIDKTDIFIHNHLHTCLLIIKIPLITITILYFLFVGIIYFLEKKHKNQNNPSLKKLRDKLAVVNNILFYIIIGVILLLSIILIYITRDYSMYVLQKTFGIKTKHEIKIPKKHLTYYMSLNWWMLIYLFVVTIFVTIAKLKHDPELIYNLF